MQLIVADEGDAGLCFLIERSHNTINLIISIMGGCEAEVLEPGEDSSKYLN